MDFSCLKSNWENRKDIERNQQVLHNTGIEDKQG